MTVLYTVFPHRGGASMTSSCLDVGLIMQLANEILLGSHRLTGEAALSF